MRFFRSLLLILASLVACGVVPAHATTIQIYRNGVKPKSLIIEEYKTRTQIQSNTPHRQLNPEKRVSEFEGVSVRHLLKLSKDQRDLIVHFVGADGYISSIPASVLLKTDAILALQENGKPISELRGGVQVIFPTEGKYAVESRYAKKAAFWCWYVRSIVVGELSDPSRIGFAHSLPQNAEEFAFEAPSGFHFEKTPCPKAFRIPLSRLTHTDAVAAQLLSGVKKELPVSRFDLVFAQGGKTLPIGCGGPFALVDHLKMASLKSPVLARDIDASVASVEDVR